MLHRVTSYFLVLFTAAGPWACCCSGLTLLDFCTPVADQSEEKPVKMPHQCCCSHGQADPQSALQEDSSPDNNSDDSTPRKCPCQERRPHALVTDDAKAGHLDLVRAGLHLVDMPVLGTHSLDLLGGLDVFSPQHVSPAFFSAKDSLRIHHVLRC